VLRFSANLSTLFLERPALRRPQAARDAGFAAVEIQFPYGHESEDWARAIEDAGVGLALINAPVGDLLAGGPGLAAMPGREAEFRQALAQARRYAERLAPRSLNILAGWPPAELGREACMRVLATNLRLAAERMAEIGVRVLVEAVNTRDRPGYLIARSDEALEAIDRAGHANLGLQYDLYHMQIMEGDLTRTLQRVQARIGHIQFADHPGRHEPGTGEIDFAHLFELIDALGYDGFVGAEYLPSKTTEQTLDWLRAASRATPPTASAPGSRSLR
jgi:hydroxypyruvate isomerase